MSATCLNRFGGDRMWGQGGPKRQLLIIIKAVLGQGGPKRQLLIIIKAVLGASRTSVVVFVLAGKPLTEPV